MAQFIYSEDNTVKVAYGTYNYKRSNGSTHKGIDISTKGDPTIHSTVSGKVKHARVVAQGAPGWGATWEWGYFVWIVADDGTDHIFAHCKAGSLQVKQGDRVKAGQAIATMGNTGNAAFDSQGPHVHYEVRKNKNAIDPTPWCGIPNRVGTTMNPNSNPAPEPGNDKEESNMPYLKIFTPREGVVSSQQVHEGVLGQMQEDGSLTGYFPAGGARLAREYTTDTLSEVFAGVVEEMQPGEMVASVDDK